MLKPTVCQWDLIPDCNLNCEHCRIHQMGYKRLKHSDLILLAEKVAASSITTLALAGGEPLIYPGLSDILSRLKMKNLIILTNGTLIDEEKVSLLKNFSCKVQVSLDGGTKEVHDNCRGVGSFDKSIRGIELLRKYEIPFWTRFTITELNKDEVADFVILSKSLGAVQCSIRRCIPVGNASSFTRLTASELQTAFGEAFSVGEKIGIKIVSPDPFAAICFNVDKKREYEELMEKYPDVCVGGCKVGITSLYIDPAGKIVFCPYAPFVCGDLLIDELDHIWNSSDILGYARNIRSNLKGKCANCKYLMVCGGCPAASYATTGSILESDADCWLK